MNFGNRTINPGDLRVRISFLTRVVHTDLGGASSISWEVSTTVWAKWTNAHGTEAIKTDAAQVEDVATVLTRYRSEISPINAIQKGNEIYEIVSPVDNIQERGEYMEFSVRRMETG